MELSTVLLVLVLSFFFHLVTQYFFVKKRRFDDFNHRTSHKTIATRSGGISIFSSLFIVGLAHYLLNIELFDYSLFIPLGILFTIGVYDDLYQADFKLKWDSGEIGVGNVRELREFKEKLLTLKK